MFADYKIVLNDNDISIVDKIDKGKLLHQIHKHYSLNTNKIIWGNDSQQTKWYNG